MPSWFVTQTVCLFVLTVTLYEVSSVLEAFVLTLAVTAGLTAYTFQTKRDFTVHYGWWVLSEVLCSCNHWCIAAKSPDSSRWTLSCRDAHFKLNMPGCKLAWKHTKIANIFISRLCMVLQIFMQQKHFIAFDLNSSVNSRKRLAHEIKCMYATHANGVIIKGCQNQNYSCHSCVFATFRR